MNKDQVKKLALMMKENVIPRGILELRRHGFIDFINNKTKIELRWFEDVANGENDYFETIKDKPDRWENLVEWSIGAMECIVVLANKKTRIEEAIEMAKTIHVAITRTTLIEKYND